MSHPREKHPLAPTLALALVAAAAGSATAAPVELELDVDALTCDHLTDESGVGTLRDEVYVRVKGDTAGGPVAGRLPAADDYYEFVEPQVSGRATIPGAQPFTNHDQQDVGAPVLWHGTLADGAAVELAVVIGEQDNKTIDDVIDPLKEAFRTAAGGVSDPTIKAGVLAAVGLLDHIPTNAGDDLLGAFVVRIENGAGGLKATWTPAGAFTMEDGGRVTTLAHPDDPYVTALAARGTPATALELQGTGGGRYRMLAAVRALRTLRAVDQVLGTTRDACGEAAFAVNGAAGRVPVGKGGTAGLMVPANRFSWTCGTSLEWTTCDAGTTYVKVTRDRGRGIAWTCVKRTWR